MEHPVTVLILAAGLGTRMKSRKAKVLHRAGGRTLIEHVVRTTVEVTSPSNVAAVIGHQAEQVKETVAHIGIQFVLQREQKGTGHAVMAARETLAGQDGLLIVLYGDGPLLSVSTLRRLLETQAESSAAATLITTTLDDPTGYGRVITDEDGRIEAIVEQKAATPEQLAIQRINSGIYCFRSGLLWKHIGEITTDNPAGEYYLTDIVEIFRKAGHDVRTMHVDDSSELLGINTREELAEVDRVFRARKVRELMLSGVTVEKPETVTIDPGVTIGQDSVVGPFAQILGNTEIGEECSVGACSIISDSRLGAGVQVGPFTVINDSVVGDGATVGPYARLRFSNHVEAGAIVGNFVELKKTHIGEGAKAMHLAYLGDSDIGADANIGAGTITCNFDGVKKHETKIGKGAFVGSNSTLVAPLNVGDDSYIGAASVITEDVPADSLALGRARQLVKTGWVKKRREEIKRKK